MDPMLDDVRSAVSGDRNALERLLGHFHPSLKEELSNRIGPRFRGRIEVEDVLQVIYLEAFLGIGGYRPGTVNAFQNWLRKIARNNLNDGIRGLKARIRCEFPEPMKQRNAHDSHTSLLQLIVTSDTTPTEYLSREEIKRLVEAAIDKLPHDYAMVVRLYDLDRQPIETVATSMNRRPGAVYMLRARAHDHLREFLAPQLIGFGLCSSTGEPSKGQET